MSKINWCLELVRIVPTTAIGIAVAYVAFRQWLTANTKVKLALFERRWSVYQAIVQKFQDFHLPDRKPIDEFIEEMNVLMLEIPFLFGHEINVVMNEWIGLAREFDIVKNDALCRDVNNQLNSRAREEKEELRSKIKAKVQEFGRLSSSYMDMSQEPFEFCRWFRQWRIKHQAAP